jgi:hypothetical protein
MSTIKVGWAWCLIRVRFSLSLDDWVPFPTWVRNFKLFRASSELCQWGDLHSGELREVEFTTGLTFFSNMHKVIAKPNLVIKYHWRTSLLEVGP